MQKISLNPFGQGWLWWGMPILFAGLAVGGAVFFVPLIQADFSDIPNLSVKQLGVAGGGGAFAGWALGVVWRFFLNASVSAVFKALIITAVAVSVLVVVECFFNSAYGNRVIWTSVQHRNAPGVPGELQGYAKFCMQRHGVLPQTSSPRVVLLGSSQINRVDPDIVQQRLPSLQVEKWALPGMGPLRMLMVDPVLKLKKGDTVVVYWSDFDMGPMSSYQAAWFRPIGNPAGVAAVLNFAEGEDYQPTWKQRVDLLLASTSSTWRNRDACQYILKRLLGFRSGQVSSADDVIAGQKRDYVLGLDSARVAAGCAAAKLLVERWNASGVHVVLVEGALNPIMLGGRSVVERQAIQQDLRDLSELTHCAYWPIAEMYTPEEDHWEDGTHLNSEGAAILARRIAEVVQPLYSGLDQPRAETEKLNDE